MLKYPLDKVVNLSHDRYMFKKHILPTITAAAISLSYTLPALAAEVNPCPKDGKFSKLCDITANPGAILGNVIIAILVVAAVIALLYLIWGGVKWIMSGGDKAKVDTARSTIIAAIVGLIVTFLAFFLVSLVLSLFGLGSIRDLTIPDITAGP